jgi:hypothetical protein
MKPLSNEELSPLDPNLRKLFNEIMTLRAKSEELTPTAYEVILDKILSKYSEETQETIIDLFITRSRLKG